MPSHKNSPLIKILTIVGPGLFLIGYNIGTGSVTTMATAGSKWGMSLSWTVVLSCVFMYIGVWAFGRYTLVTGDTILLAIRRNFKWGKPISLFIMSALILAEFSGVMGLSAIIVDLTREWIQYATGYENKWIKLGITFILSGITFGMLWRGSYTYLEKFLAILVGIMGVCFVITAVSIVPSWKEIVRGLIPSVPRESGASLIVAGMAGTTFSSAVLYCRSIILKNKGWDLAKSRQANFDAAFSAVFMFLLSIAVMICAAGTLYVKNQPVENAVDMVRTLEPLAGQFAITLFVIGILGAGISSLIPTILIAPWLISDYSNAKINPRSKSSRIFVILGAVLSLAGPYIANPVFLMILTMAFLAIIVPLSTISITVLLNQKQMGTEKNNGVKNLWCAAMILFSVIMAYYGVVGVREQL